MTTIVSIETEKVAVIEKRLAEVGKSAPWLAKRINVTKQTIYNWFKGSIPQDGEKLDAALLVLAEEEKVLGSILYPAAQLEVEMSLWPSLPADENWSDPGDAVDFIGVPGFLARKNSKCPERIASYVQGDSMAPRIHKGDLLIIDLMQDAPAGRIVVARAGREMTVKVLRRGANGRFLEALNPEAGEVVPLDSNIVGMVVAIVRDYRGEQGFVEWDSGGIVP